MSITVNTPSEQETPAMLTCNQFHSETAGEMKDHPFRYYCKLFDDMIVRELCFLRRNHFSDRQLFSCRGCSKDTILNSPHNRARGGTARRS